VRFAKIARLCAPIRKTPIVVNDGAVLLCQRCIHPLRQTEGAAEITEGYSTAAGRSRRHQLLASLWGPCSDRFEPLSNSGGQDCSRGPRPLWACLSCVPTDDLILWIEDLGPSRSQATLGFFDYDGKGQASGYWKGMHDKFR